METTVQVDAARIFWNVVPYVVIAVFGVAIWWRYTYDKFGWTSRSSQLYESRLLRIGSPMFHYGSFVVIAGHIMGLFIPESWTEFFGMSDHVYHLQALILGLPAGLATVVGLGLLIYRRRLQRSVYLATTVNDKLMYVVLVSALIAGMACTLMGATTHGEQHDYRQTVSVWFRSIWYFDPRGDVMAHAAIYYQIHVLIAMTLFVLWPFTRLVHAFSAPIWYLFRPYILYRSRDAATNGRPLPTPQRRGGW